MIAKYFSDKVGGNNGRMALVHNLDDASAILNLKDEKLYYTLYGNRGCTGIYLNGCVFFYLLLIKLCNLGQAGCMGQFPLLIEFRPMPPATSLYRSNTLAGFFGDGKGSK